MVLSESRPRTNEGHPQFFDGLSCVERAHEKVPVVVIDCLSYYFGLVFVFGTGQEAVLKSQLEDL